MFAFRGSVLIIRSSPTFKWHIFHVVALTLCIYCSFLCVHRALRCRRRRLRYEEHLTSLLNWGGGLRCDAARKFRPHHVTAHSSDDFLLITNVIVKITATARGSCLYSSVTTITFAGVTQFFFFCVFLLFAVDSEICQQAVSLSWDWSKSI